MNLRITYIDDEIEMCATFADLYESDSVTITTFSDPTLAISQICCDRPDFVFIDFRLPTMTGNQVVEAIPPEIPAALISGDLSVTPSPRFEKVFGKPFDFDEMEGFIKGLQQRASANNS